MAKPGRTLAAQGTSAWPLDWLISCAFRRAATAHHSHEINFLFRAGDGSGRLFVNDMRSKIYIIRNGKVLPTPFLDIAAVRTSHFVADGGSNRHRSRPLRKPNTQALESVNADPTDR